MYLRIILSTKNITLEQLSKKTQISRVELSEYKNDRKIPSMKRCYTIANALGIEPMIYHEMCQKTKMKKYIEKIKQMNSISSQIQHLINTMTIYQEHAAALSIYRLDARDMKKVRGLLGRS